MNSEPSKAGLAVRALETWLFLLRHETKYTRIHLRRLMLRNRFSTAPVVSAGGPVVSLTTYGQRFRSVHLVIESIAAGSLLPSRLILWIDNPADLDRQPAGLRRLVDRGLEIRLSDNYGPHTKYFPWLLAEDNFDVPLVTADDDLVYSRWWLEGLVRANREYPDAINCYRAHVVHTTGGFLAPYNSWKPCHSSQPSFSHFATGVSGCIYPPGFLAHLKRAGDAFLTLCPKADDVWLHMNALRSGYRVRQIRTRPLRFPFVPGTQNSGLYHDNVLQSRNDDHIRSTYSAADIEMLESSSRELTLTA